MQNSSRVAENNSQGVIFVMLNVVVAERREAHEAPNDGLISSVEGEVSRKVQHAIKGSLPPKIGLCL